MTLFFHKYYLILIKYYVHLSFFPTFFHFYSLFFRFAPYFFVFQPIFLYFCKQIGLYALSSTKVSPSESIQHSIYTLYYKKK